MTPNLIVTRYKKSFEKKVIDIIKIEENECINNLYNSDIFTYGLDITALSTSTIRDFLSSKNFKPTQLKSNYILFYNFENFNIEMQNIILKLLEESYTNIFLQTSNIHLSVQTIISRCKIIKLKDKVKYNKDIFELLEKIIFNNDLSQITKLSKFDINKVLRNTEFFMKKNRQKFESKNYINSVKKIYELYKYYDKTKGLNFELQFINVIVSLLEKKTI